MSICKQKLIELLDKAFLEVDENFGRPCTEQVADYLMLNNVFFLPLTVGDFVYVPWHWFDESGISVVDVQEIRFYGTSGHWMFFIDLESDDLEFNLTFGGWKLEEAIGKHVFLSRSEAENSLKGDLYEHS